VRIDSNYFGAHFNLGVALVQVGQVEEGIRHLEQALRIAPDSFEAHLGIAAALARLGKGREAVQHLEQSLLIKPDSVVAQSRLAVLLATLPQSAGGQPARAVELAEKACQLTSNQVASTLDTLALAYAAAGRFDEATVTAERAVQLARAASQLRLADEIKERLEFYRSGKAYRRSAGAIGPKNP